MRVMVLGAGGMLGHDLLATAPHEVDLVALTRAPLDITDPHALEQRLAEIEPDIVINAAAYTAVDKAEADRDRAFQVNAEAVGYIGRAAARIGATVVHFSSDYVFDGTSSRPYNEDDRTNPVNVYGASKVAGETALADSGARYLLLRTSWLFGENGRSFPRTMWERARARQSTHVVNDQHGRPTYTLDLALATWQLVRSEATGVLHLANTGATTWFSVGAFVFSFAGAPNLVSACSTKDYPTPARRPQSGVLDTTRADALLGKPLSTWQSALQRFLHTLAASHGGT